MASVILETEESSAFKIFLSASSMLARILIGIVSGVSFLYAVRNGLPLNATNAHIIICVLGYQILMTEAILCMSSEGGWTASIKPLHRKRAHAVVQIVGSVLALVGSFQKIIDKGQNFNTNHGKLGFVAMVFTTVSLVNGLTSFYAYELRNCLPGKLSKTTHICFGIVAFVTASLTLILGIDKAGFRIWATQEFADTLIAFTVIFTVIVIINPLIVFMKRLKD